MKKLYTEQKYKKWHNRRAKRKSRRLRRNKHYIFKPKPIYNNFKNEYIKALPIKAPQNLCLITKTKECLDFFIELRKETNISKTGLICFVQIDLSSVVVLEYSSICILIAIIEDLKSKKIYLRSNYPQNVEAKQKLIESGILTFMYNDKGKPFKKSEKSDLLFIEKGNKKLTRSDNKRISDTVKHVAKHLLGEEKHIPKLRTILLEICGNSIEWGGTINKQWLLGVKYEEDNVIFTITDVGKGILRTLNKKFKYRFKDFFAGKSEDEILIGAFLKKYGSSSREVNRNKGLPSIKHGYDTGTIKNLKVLTNNVMIHYDEEISSEVLKDSYFCGTLYRWIVSKETILKAGL